MRSYDNDDAAPSKEQFPTQTAPEPIQSEHAPGYGEEPDTGHDPNSFEMDAAMQEQHTNGAAEMALESTPAPRGSEPGIQMKEDG